MPPRPQGIIAAFASIDEFLRKGKRTQKAGLERVEKREEKTQRLVERFGQGIAERGKMQRRDMINHNDLLDEHETDASKYKASERNQWIGTSERGRAAYRTHACRSILSGIA